MKYYVDQQGKQVEVALDIDKQIGRGAMGVVHHVKRPFSGSVAKLYHNSDVLNTDKITAMIAKPPANMDYKINGHSIPQFAWPTHFLTDGKKALGYLMPEIPLDGSETLEVLINPLLRRRYGLEKLEAITLRVSIARNLAALLQGMHEQKHYFIDVKPQNIRVYKDNLLVVLLDCDGFSISQDGRTAFPATTYSAEYIAPEALNNYLSPKALFEYQDRFALAVLVFQILNNGIHPFQGVLLGKGNHTELNTIDSKVSAGLYAYSLKKHPLINGVEASIHNGFAHATRLMFDRAFTGKPSERPTAQEWYRHLSRLLDSKYGHFQRCRDKPDDASHIHFKGQACMACKLDRLSNTRAVQKMDSAGMRQTPMAETAAAVGTSYTLVCPECGSSSRKNRFYNYLMDGLPITWYFDLVACSNCKTRYSRSGKAFSNWLLHLYRFALTALIVVYLIYESFG